MITQILCLVITMTNLVLIHGQDVECTAGWSLYEEAGSCFKAFHEAKTSWSGAKIDCQNEGGNLVKIDGPGTRDFINDLISEDNTYWIGLHDPDKDGKFQWLDEQKQASFENWHCREPNNHRGNERCVEIVGRKNGKWNDKRCSRKRSFICQKEAKSVGPIEVVTCDYETEDNGKCIFNPETNSLLTRKKNNPIQNADPSFKSYTAGGKKFPGSVQVRYGYLKPEPTNQSLFWFASALLCTLMEHNSVLASVSRDPSQKLTNFR